MILMASAPGVVVTNADITLSMVDVATILGVVWIIFFGLYLWSNR